MNSLDETCKKNQNILDSEINTNEIDKSKDLIPLNFNVSKIKNDLSPDINLLTIVSGAPVITEKKEVENSSTCSSEKNPETDILLTKKAILSCLNAKCTTKMLQKILMETSKDIVATIVKELSGTYRDIIKDKNGNYFCTDLFKICEQSQRIMILKELTKTISEDCTHEFATHPIQTLIDFSSCEEEYKLILESFYDYKKFFYASFNSWGSYAIQKIIEHIPEKFRKQFNLLFITFIPMLSLKQYGVCSVKKFITYSKNEELNEKVVNLIRKNFVKIAINNFGNFLIQFMLKQWINESYGKKLMQVIRDNFLILYQNKYSYYICDLYLKFASNEEKLYLSNIMKLNSIQFNNNNFMPKNITNNNQNQNFNKNYKKNFNQNNMFMNNNNINNIDNQNNSSFLMNFFQKNNNNNWNC